MFKKLLLKIPVFKELENVQKRICFLIKGIKKIKKLLRTLDSKNNEVKEIKKICNELLKGELL